MRLTALSVDLQVGKQSATVVTPIKDGLQNDASDDDGRRVTPEGYVHEGVVSGQNDSPTSTKDEAADGEVSSTHATSHIYGSEPESDWETGGIPIDRS